MPGSIAETVARMMRDHARLNELAIELKRELNTPTPGEPDALKNARWAFASTLLTHLAFKEKHVYAKLEQDDRPEITRYSESSKDDLLRRFADYTQHMEEWPTTKAMQNWSIYKVRAVAVVDAFLQRLRWEETDLLPFVERHHIDISEPSPLTSNWVRKAFDIKQSVENR